MNGFVLITANYKVNIHLSQHSKYLHFAQQQTAFETTAGAAKIVCFRREMKPKGLFWHSKDDLFHFIDSNKYNIETYKNKSR